MISWKRLLGLETRAGGYTDQVTAAILERAGQPAEADPSKLAAITTASGVWSRAMAGLSAEGRHSEAVTPGWLSRVGADLVRRGEHFSLLEIADGRPILLPAISADVDRTGRWRLELPEPGRDEAGKSRRRTVTAPVEQVVSLVWESDPSQPGRGCGPPWKGVEAELGVELQETALRAPLPAGILSTEQKMDTEGRQRTRDSWRQSFGSARGKRDVGLLDQDMKILPLAHPGSDPLRAWTESREAAILAACGIPPGIEGRDQWRHFLTAAVGPMARRMQEELQRKLVVDIEISLAPLRGNDLATRTRSAKQLHESGFSKDEIQRICDL